MVNIILILLISLFIPGVINRTRARLSGRMGIPVLKHLSTVIVEVNKGSIYDQNCGLLFRLAPIISLGAVLTALLMIPFGRSEALISFEGDFVAVIYLFAVSRFITIVGAMGTGSSFEGMGASREALYGALIEPAIFVVIGALALISGNSSFSAIYSSISAVDTETIIATIILYYVLLRVGVVETGHLPVDDPRTHLELTMVHEVMVLDYSGIDLAFINIANWIKGGIFTVLAGGIVTSSFSYNATATVLFALLQGVIIGVIESFSARNKLSKNATYIVAVTATALMAFTICYLITNDINITLE